MAYRAVIYDSTGYTPARLIFERQFGLICDLVYGSSNQTATQDVANSAENSR